MVGVEAWDLNRTATFGTKFHSSFPAFEVNSRLTFRAPPGSSSLDGCLVSFCECSYKLIKKNVWTKYHTGGGAVLGLEYPEKWPRDLRTVPNI